MPARAQGPAGARHKMNIPLTPLRCIRYAEQQFPRHTAVVCGVLRFTYRQFADRAARLGGALRAMGIGPGDRVAFLSTNCHRLLEAYFGVIEASAVLLPVNIRLAPPEVAFILNDSQASVLFFERQFTPLVEALAKSVPSVRYFVPLDTGQQLAWAEPEDYDTLLAAATPHRRDVMEIDEDSVAEIFYTSGTSAKPKGVMLTHRNIYLHALNTAIALGMRHGSVELHTIPLFHANGWGKAHILCLVSGTHVMIHQFVPAEVFRLIETERVEACCLVPTMAAALINSPDRDKYDLSSLERVIIGGAANSPALVRAVESTLGCACISGYGLTETSPVLSLSTIKPGLSTDSPARDTRQSFAGYAIPGTEIRIVDQNDCDIPSDGASIGHVVSRADHIMAGYWQQPEETRRVFQNGWFHTGDLGTIDDDNYLLIVDREKDIIVSGGENISSLELERTLAGHPAVYEVAVIPVPDEKWGEVPKACVVAKPGTKVTASELIDLCRSCLARYKCPHSIEFVETLPKTGTGKILKRELRKAATVNAR